MTHGTSEPALSGGDIFAFRKWAEVSMSESIFRLSASEGSNTVETHSAELPLPLIPPQHFRLTVSLPRHSVKKVPSFCLKPLSLGGVGSYPCRCTVEK